MSALVWNVIALSAYAMCSAMSLSALSNSSTRCAFSSGVPASGADTVTIWGTGTPQREFLHVDDMAAASLFVLDLNRETYQANTEPMLSHINVGTGTDVSIRELAEMIAEVTGFKGRIAFDSSKPDGTPRKLLNVSRLARMGWTARIGLREGLASTYEWFLTHAADMRQ